VLPDMLPRDPSAGCASCLRYGRPWSPERRAGRRPHDRRATLARRCARRSRLWARAEQMKIERHQGFGQGLGPTGPPLDASARGAACASVRERPRRRAGSAGFPTRPREWSPAPKSPALAAPYAPQ
jgi:hypothetical protein